MQSLISKLLGRRPDPTATWPKIPISSLEISTPNRSVNGLCFSDDISMAARFGRPDSFRWQNSDSCELLYLSEGFELHFEKELFCYCAFYLGADGLLPKGARFSSPSLDSLPALSVSTNLSDVRAKLGPPVSEDMDDDESILFYHLNGLTVEFEAAPQGSLKRLNIYPLKETKD